MSAPELPAWPKLPGGEVTANAWVSYRLRECRALEARVKALVEVVRGLLDQQAYPDERFNAYIAALLAACERKEVGNV